MIINKQLFEDVLSGKLKGTFVLRDGNKVKSCKLLKGDTYYHTYYPIFLMGNWYTYQGEHDLTRKNHHLDIIDFIPDKNMKENELTNMKENELTIEIPNGKIVDWEESKKQNKIVLKDKQLTYEDICERYLGNDIYYIMSDGNIGYILGTWACNHTPNCSKSQYQLECILAKNKLANVAMFLNDGWKPSKGDHVFAITYPAGNFDNEPIVGEHYFGNGENLVLFKTQKDAKQAIEILGKETIKLALKPLGI